jgi:hypothetical protein
VSELPIPAEFWGLILAFLHERRTGQLVLNVSEGAVSSLEIRSTFRPSRGRASRGRSS